MEIALSIEGHRVPFQLGYFPGVLPLFSILFFFKPSGLSLGDSRTRTKISILCHIVLLAGATFHVWIRQFETFLTDD